MNIFEEITESYTYNGTVSIKALEDDIVTLENQIDRYNATLREIQLRGKKSSVLIEKIRDAKMRLSLLRAVLKREKDKASPDDIIKNMLGISAKDANETETPASAASNKTPIPQNFEKAEIEIVNEEEDSTAIEDETKSEKEVIAEDVKNEKIGEDDIVIEKEKQNEVASEAKVDGIEKNDSEIIEETHEKTEEHEVILNKADIISEHSVVKPGVIINQETGIVTVSKTLENQTEYFIPENEKNKDEEIKKTVEMEKYKVSDDDYNLTKATKEELAEFYATLKSDNTIQVTENEEIVEKDNEVPDIDCPPPTIDDYTERIDGPEILTYDTDEGKSFESVEVFEEPPIKENNIISSEEINEDTYDSIAFAQLTEKDLKEYDMDTVYEPFPKDEDRIYASFDLCEITDRVNTLYVTGVIIPDKKKLRVTFFDLRDYEIFYTLLKKYEKEKCNIFKWFKKNLPSIFMTVTNNICGKVAKYEYVFSGCRIVEVEDTPYGFKDPHNIMETNGTETGIHNCCVTFKYKKLVTK